MDEPGLGLSRAEALEALAGRRFDLLVVGGGIVGAGIAAEAARAGLAVALVDRGDFGAATSSGSSKLIHGGLRYLALGDVRLVREAHQERRALMRVVAPHLVRKLPFLLPLYRGGPHRPWVVRTGLWLYSALAGDRLGGLAPPERALRSVPHLRTGGLIGCGLYADAWTNDARLCLANVTAAAEAGAVALNHAEVAALRIEGGRAAGAEVVDRVGGEAVSVRAAAVVNATGPWVDRVRRLEDPRARPSCRLSKGVHVLVPQPPGWSAALTIPQDGVRVTFAIPWEGMLLLGTTDEGFDEDPDAVEPTAADVAQVLREAAVAVDAELLAPDRVRFAFAGLRVLPGTGGSTATARRETVISRGPAGMVSIAGGKLTTYRRIALAALAAVGVRGLSRRPVPLPGASGLEAAGQELGRRHAELEPSVRAHLLHLYGSRALAVLAAGEAAPIDPGGPDLVAQVEYARRREWAVTAEDVLRRRTTLAYRGLSTRETTARVAALLGAAAPVDADDAVDAAERGRDARGVQA